MFAVWTGPIPYLHCHGALDSASEAGFVQLAKHLSRYHKCDATCCSKNYGWHFHMAVPTSDEDGSVPPTQWLSANAMSTATSSIGDDWQCDRLVLPNFLISADFLEASAPGRQYLSRSFYDSYARTLPLPMRFSVVRC
ncbi:hypothetical protein C5Y97_02345 [Blastopirellula marina]|uniref:Uncharacterized protein n=2 Tax=Blastopirellula marina TaxID=124 RepID=A0A2S8GBT4_9BACT|nr:hypothetical protein C5Y98_02345 [Blastopirellula marina]PTL46255.1 hypothetical protein C5Y97_02345 [Blastopirellula marina]